METSIVRFVRSFPPYVPNDLAGFGAARAADLVRGGFAVHVEPQIDGPGSLAPTPATVAEVNVPDARALIAAARTRSELAAFRAAEDARPGGSRVGVLAAIETAEAAMDSEEEEEEAAG